MARQGRSPAYPGMNLEQAIQKTHEFYSANRRYPVDRSDKNPVAYKSIGYTGANGASKRALAALLAFGLLERVGSGDESKVQVSELGYKIIALPEDDGDRVDAIADAFLSPKIYKDICEQFPQGIPPSDGPIHSYLVKRGFSPEAIPGLIADFRTSYEFGHSALYGKMDDGADDQKPKEPVFDLGQPGFVPASSRPKGPGSGMRELAIPLGPDSQIVLHYPANLKESDFDFFVTMLGSFKPRIVTLDVEPEEPEESDETDP